jgi:hypothetical protein
VHPLEWRSLALGCWVRSLFDMDWLNARQFLTCWPGCLQCGAEPTLQPAYEGGRLQPSPGRLLQAAVLERFRHGTSISSLSLELTPSSALGTQAVSTRSRTDDILRLLRIMQNLMESSNPSPAWLPANMAWMVSGLARDISNGVGQPACWI